MPEKRTIKAKQIVTDVRAGVSESELMAKYMLSFSELRTVVERLTQSGHLREREVEEWRTASGGASPKSGTRELPRAYLRIPPEISDDRDRTNRGLVTDISVGGFRTRAMASRVGDQHRFVIHASEIADIEDIEVSATCKWYSAEPLDINLQEAGFRIDSVSAGGTTEILKLIKFLSIGDRNRRRG